MQKNTFKHKNSPNKIVLAVKSTWLVKYMSLDTAKNNRLRRFKSITEKKLQSLWRVDSISYFFIQYKKTKNA